VIDREFLRGPFYRDMARRYLHDRHVFWVGAYGQLENHGRQADDYHYTERALDIFPRYNVLAAIGVEVDSLDPDALPRDDDVLERLRVAGGAAEGLLTGHEQGSTEDLAERSERERFLEFVGMLPSAEMTQVALLSYRRTLTADEPSRWRSAVERRWPLTDGGFWAPLRYTTVEDQPVLALRADAFWEGNEPDGPASLAVRSALIALGVNRLIELREYGPQFEREASTLQCTYNGAEGLFFSERLDWLIFASHEGVTTFGGSVVTELRASWSDLDRHIWDEQS